MTSLVNETRLGFREVNFIVVEGLSIGMKRRFALIVVVRVR